MLIKFDLYVLLSQIFLLLLFPYNCNYYLLFIYISIKHILVRLLRTEPLSFWFAGETITIEMEPT